MSTNEPATQRAMRASQKTVPVSYRLLAGGAFWFPLLAMVDGWTGSSSGWALRTSLLQGGFAAGAVAILLPVLLRGDWVQRILAAVLLTVPAIALLGAFFIANGTG